MQARCASTHHGQSVHCICVHNNSNAANTSASTTLPQASHTYFGLHTMAPTHLICTAQYTRKYSTPQHSGSEKNDAVTYSTVTAVPECSKPCHHLSVVLWNNLARNKLQTSNCTAPCLTPTRGSESEKQNCKNHGNLPDATKVAFSTAFSIAPAYASRQQQMATDIIVNSTVASKT